MAPFGEAPEGAKYKSVQGMMIPMAGEVAWIRKGGASSSYYRGRTVQITFELAA